MKNYTIDEIKSYLESCSSLKNAINDLSEDNLDEVVNVHKMTEAYSNIEEQ